MLLPISKTKFPDLITAIDRLYETYVSEHADDFSSDASNMDTVAGYLMCFNFTMDELADSKSGSFKAARSKVAAWLRKPRTRNSVSAFREKFTFKNPVKFAGVEIRDTTQAYENAGILGFICGALNIGLRYVNDTTQLSEYISASSLLRERFALPIKRRRVRINKMTDLTAGKQIDRSGTADLFRNSYHQLDWLTTPAGDEDVNVLARVIFSVAVKRTLNLGGAYVDDAAMLRDNLGFEAFARVTAPTDAPIAQFLTRVSTSAHKHPDFVTPHVYVLTSIVDGVPTYTGLSDPLALSDPETVDKLYRRKLTELPAGLAKDLLALESKRGSLDISDTTTFVETWRPDPGYVSKYLNAALTHFALNYLRTVTGVATASSIPGSGRGLWRRSYTITNTIAEFITNSAGARAVWSDHDPKHGYYLGLKASEDDTSKVEGSIILYLKGVDDIRKALQEMFPFAVRVEYTDAVGKVNYQRTLNFAMDSFAAEHDAYKITFSWEDPE